MNPLASSRLSASAATADEAAVVLLGRIAAKDRDAFRQFYFDCSPRIGKFLSKLLKHPELVDEAVNDVMLAVWQCAGEFDPAKGRFSTWLFGIAHNKGLKILERQRRYRAEQPVEDEPGEGHEEDGDGPAPAEHGDPSDPERIVLGWELGEILGWALERLSAEHRAVLELTFGEECSYQEIAEIVGCPINTVKTRVFHARKKLFELLARRGYSPSALALENRS
jgi:RNA polymerase sigma-70 factor (ECF subfamily)